MLFIVIQNVVYLLTSQTNGILVPHCVLMSMMLVLALTPKATHSSLPRRRPTLAP